MTWLLNFYIVQWKPLNVITIVVVIIRLISSIWQCSFSCITANHAKMIFGWCYQMTWAKSDHIKRCLLLYKETRHQWIQWIQMNFISSTFFKRRRKSTSTEESWVALSRFKDAQPLKFQKGGGGGPWGLEKIFWGVCLRLHENLGGTLIFLFYCIFMT